MTKYNEQGVCLSMSSPYRYISFADNMGDVCCSIIIKFFHANPYKTHKALSVPSFSDYMKRLKKKKKEELAEELWQTYKSLKNIRCRQHNYKDYDNYYLRKVSKLQQLISILEKKKFPIEKFIFSRSLTHNLWVAQRRSKENDIDRNNLQKDLH